MLKYHAKSLGLVGATLSVDPAAELDIEQFERHYGIELPESVREWYSLRGVDELMQRVSDDSFVALDPLNPAYSWNELDDVDLIERGLLVFRVENQAVAQWAVKIDGSSDPDVVSEVDGEEDWIESGVRFSEFIWTWIWDHHSVQGSKYLLMANELPIRKGALAVLKSRLTSELTTKGFPGHTQLRFSDPEVLLLLWLSKDQTDWFCAPTTREGVDAAIQVLLDAGISPKALYAHNGEIEEVLRRLPEPFNGR